MGRTPLLWLALCCEEWGCSRSLAERTWSGLRASRWARAAALRQFVLAQPYVNPAHFRQQYAPHALIAVLEGLVKERQLSRAQGTHLEAAILCQVQANGRWRTGPETGAGASAHPPDILTLATTGQAS